MITMSDVMAGLQSERAKLEDETDRIDKAIAIRGGETSCRREGREVDEASLGGTARGSPSG